MLKTETRLIFGPIAAGIFVAGLACLALLVPGYSHLQQSFSAIAKPGTPTRVSFALVIVSYACSLLMFAPGIFRLAAKSGAPKLLAYSVSCMRLTQLGIAIFATPPPLHNILGLLSMSSYLATLILAFTWRRVGPRSLILASYALGLMVVGTIVLNLSELFPQSALWQLMSPHPGLPQRMHVAVWLTWLITAGSTMSRQQRSQHEVVNGELTPCSPPLNGPCGNSARRLRASWNSYLHDHLNMNLA